jgi:hypothetical protein
MPKLLIFPDPLDARCELRHDDGSGLVVIAVPDTHSQGRRGQSFAIPTGLPQGHGARLFISSPGKVQLEQRGALWYDDGIVQIPFPEGGACLFTDDFRLVSMPTVPVIPDTHPDPNKDPFKIIVDTYNPTIHDLTTHDGCGKFTEDCCKALHEQHNITWGHVRKSGAQEQYNGHAIDAIQILMAVTNTPAGTYDIVQSSQSPSAKPSFNRVDDAHQSLWYYPA